eukprot:6459444-Amphidinium_carterae.1
MIVSASSVTRTLANESMIPKHVHRFPTQRAESLSFLNKYSTLQRRLRANWNKLGSKCVSPSDPGGAVSQTPDVGNRTTAKCASQKAGGFGKA